MIKLIVQESSIIFVSILIKDLKQLPFWHGSSVNQKFHCQKLFEVEMLLTNDDSETHNLYIKRR